MFRAWFGRATMWNNATHEIVNTGYGLKVKMRVGDKAGGYELPF